MLNIGLVVAPGFQMMSLAALSVFEMANFNAGEKLYRIRVLSEGGGPVASSIGTSMDTQSFRKACFRHAARHRDSRTRRIEQRSVAVRSTGIYRVPTDRIDLHRRIRAGRGRLARRTTCNDALAACS